MKNQILSNRQDHCFLGTEIFVFLIHQDYIYFEK